MPRSNRRMLKTAPENLNSPPITAYLYEVKVRFLFITLALLATNKSGAQQAVPEAPKHDHIHEEHGNKRYDPYSWMNQRDSKEVLDYISAENAYSGAYFSRLQPLTSALVSEFEKRIDPNEQGAPFGHNGQLFQWQNLEGKDYRVLNLLTGKTSKPYFDENQRAKGFGFYGLGEFQGSPDNKLFAVSEDFVGRRKYNIAFRDNATGKFLKDKLTNTDGSITWFNDNKTILYVRKDETTLREFQVWKHILGTAEKSDQLVYQEDDERFSVYVDKSFDDQYIVIYSESTTTSEARVIPADTPANAPQIFLKRETNHLYHIDHHERGFYFISNQNSPNGKLLFSKDIPPNTESCEVIIAHDPKVYLEEFVAFSNYIVVQQKENGLNTFHYSPVSSIGFKPIVFDEPVYEAAFSWNDDYHADFFNYSYTSLTTPASIARYSFSTGQSEVFYRKKIIDPSFKPENYQSERVWITANDGTKVAVSLVYKKGIDLKTAPLLLYGYGSYGVTIPANFSAYRLSLLDRGFVYAIAHIRGGKYLGEEWYQDGKLQHKRNTFTDFVNCAEWLAMHGYCDPNAIYAQGGSAGGLLMGAVANSAPHVFKGMIAQVPFVDVVSTMMDESIPLTVGEYEEWGNPNEPESYWYMLSYSPYDNVRAAHYPAMLITTGYHDSQVQYWEPLKWVARLRDLNLGDKVLLFDCTMSAGHGGGSGRTTERMEIAKEYAFLIHEQGLEK